MGVFLVATILPGCTQQKEPTLPHERKIKPRYQFSGRIISDLKIEGNHHDAAVAFANIGKHFEAIEVFDRQGYSTGPDVSLAGSKLLAVPAVDYVISEAARNQITIINEEHHVATHRFFSQLLLQGLYDAGYRYFGAETLNPYDSLLPERGYPTLTSGYYTAEPQYGNLIREAIRIGCTVFAYEAMGGKNGRQREIEQARNIAAILEKDSAAKIFVHCGYAHLIETPMVEWEYAMAGWLRKFTGIDPLTVEQVELSEHSAPEFENPYYREMAYTDFVALIVGTGAMPLRLRQDGSGSDMFVYHPRTRLIHGRPHWLYQRYEPLFINDSIKLKFPVIVKAYLSHEDSTAVPADVVELAAANDSTALMIGKSKKYRIEISNQKEPDQVMHISGQLVRANNPGFYRPDFVHRN